MLGKEGENSVGIIKLRREKGIVFTHGFVGRRQHSEFRFFFWRRTACGKGKLIFGPVLFSRIRKRIIS